MKKLFILPPITACVIGLLWPAPNFAQMAPAAPKASSVTMEQQPTLESAHDDVAIIRWTTNNPGGSAEHYGVVTFGTSSSALTQTAKSHVRLNQGHPDTVFRVRLAGLQPQTTYYFRVSSVGGDDKSDGAESDVGRFTTPPPGQRIQNYPQP
jgi:phosphodiesterase/alkaline phosphatase D-like protein